MRLGNYEKRSIVWPYVWWLRYELTDTTQLWTGDNTMSTEQQIKSAIDTLNEALELMQKLGFVTEGDEEDEWTYA